MSVSPDPRPKALRFLASVRRPLALPLLLTLSFAWGCSSDSVPGRGSAGSPGAVGGAGSGAGQVAGGGGAVSGGGAAAGGRGGALGAAGDGAPTTAGGGSSQSGGSSQGGGSSPSGGASPNGGASPSGGSSTGGAWVGEWPPAATFQNPILWQDLADPEVIRVGDVFYYTGSNMHHSPGAPILRSYDLVNWEFAGHAIPSQDFGAAYRLQGTQRAYIGGNWASSLRYRESDKKFYFLACIRTGQTYVWKASQVEGPWVRGPSVGNCYYDAGMLIDTDDKIYVAYGHGNISVAELNADASAQVRAAQVFTTPGSIGTLEGSRMYHVGKYYYIWATRPANGQYVLRSTAPFGPYESREILLNLGGPTQGAGVPHQGGLVETQAGDWYYMGFVDAFPGARMPVLDPITFENDWPVLVKLA